MQSTNRLVYKGDWTFSVRKDFILHPGLPIGPKLLYLALRSYCNSDNDTAFPSCDTLAAALRVSRDSIFNYSATLEECGLLERSQQHVGEGQLKGQFTHTLYTLHDTTQLKPLGPKPPRQLSDPDPSRVGKLPSRQTSVTENIDTNKSVHSTVEDHPTVERENQQSFPEIPPMKKEDFDKLWQMRGIQKDCAERFWNTFDARGWVDSHGQPVRKVEPLLINYAVSWRARAARSSSGGSSAKSSTASARIALENRIKTTTKIVEDHIGNPQNGFNRPPTPEERQEYRDFCKLLRELNAKFAKGEYE